MLKRFVLTKSILVLVAASQIVGCTTVPMNSNSQDKDEELRLMRHERMLDRGSLRF